MLPKDLPPASTVQRYFYDWRDSGLWRTISNHLVMEARELEGREASPSAGIIDSQSVKTTERRGSRLRCQNGVRWSTANAYLRPAMPRPNLHVVTRAMTRRLVIENGRAVGVEYERGGTVETARCGREIIVASGAIGSPHLLQRSGIGAGAVLQAAGVEVVHDLPGVGENLQDHSEIYIQYACKQPITLNGRMDPLGKLRIGLEWILLRRGLGVTNHFESGGFIRSDASLKSPDIQFHFLPAAMRYDGKQPLKGHGFMVLAPRGNSSRPTMTVPKTRMTARQGETDSNLHPKREQRCALSVDLGRRPLRC